MAFWRDWRCYLMVLVSCPLFAQELTLEQLMDHLSSVTRVNAHFREIRELSVLTEPLLLTGILNYQAPDYLKKQTLLPQRDVLEIKADRIKLEAPGQAPVELTLDVHPVLRAFVESLRGTLAGDLESLRRFYKIELTGSLGDWRLVLRPLEPQMAQFIESIAISGRAAEVVAVETRESGGDRSIMHIEPLSEQ